MNHQVNIHQAKTHLSRLIEEAAGGTEVVIAKSGKPVARLIAYQPPRGTRKPGIWKSRVEFADDFESLPPEMEAAFRGESD
ncbi:MAG: type II toxin-antitoxin system Phd/YefM family antitoxin [Nitrosospira sp.]|nr:type II toxin-antitoxin system Phd/YefM family antitoxin [Nitrosospira sp.]